MLQRLRVQNLAIVETAQVDFGGGLNVVTGETGAGKSVLIGALDLVLGERADKGIVRAGAREAAVEAIFQLDACGPLDALLAESGLPPCAEGQLIVRRTVAAAGGGRCLVNDAAVTVQTLRRLGTLLVDMHGPYDHQSLLDPLAQLDLLDAFGTCGKPLAAYGEGYEALRALQRQRDALLGDAADPAVEIDRLQYVVDEISGAQLTEADESDLVRQHAEAANAEAILAAGAGLLTLLDEGDESAFNLLVRVQQQLGELARLLPDAESWRREAQSAAVQVQELSRAISDRIGRVETDSEQLGRLETRMALVQKLKRKHGATVAAILETLARHQARLDELRSRDTRLAALEQEIRAADRHCRALGETLRQVRHAAAGKLAKAITRELRDLGFAKAGFSVDLAPAEPGPHGMDTVDFGFAPNPGEPQRPLRAIASSGEIARVMLATKAVLARHDRIPLLVFDEIDANIGGETGRAVGVKLRAVAASHQVICITHLPQVAAFGDAHFVVTKRIEGQRTCAHIAPVADEDRADELARMLGGRDLTALTLAHARAMLQACRTETTT